MKRHEVDCQSVIVAAHWAQQTSTSHRRRPGIDLLGAAERVSLNEFIAFWV
jgi:hypothetical protein